MDEPYENLVAAIALIDAAMEQIDGHGVCDTLHDIRNELNSERLTHIGNGPQGPFYVSQLKIT